MNKRRLLICILSFVVVLFTGAQLEAAKSIKYFVMVPPEQMLENVKKIAVLDFIDARNRYASKEGKKAADYVVSSLLKKDRGIHNIEKGVSRFLKREGLVSKGSLLGKVLGKGKQGKTFQQGFSTDFYEISERSRINQIIEEQQFSNSGMVDGSQAAELGKVLGVDAVISGNVSTTTDSKRYYSKLTKEYYYMNEATATLSMRIVEVSTGKIIGQKVATRKLNVLAEESPMDIVKENAIEAAAADLVFYFAPSFKLEKIKYQIIKSKRHKSECKKAIKYLKRGEFGRTLTIYNAIVNADPYNHQAVYMQGLSYEMACNYDKALERYKMAYQIMDESDDYYKAIERIEGQKEMWRVLNENDIYMTVKNINQPENQATAATQKVKLKGTSKNRVPVYGATDQSNIIMNIPGGLSLDLIAKEKSHYKGKLITGKEGYIRIQDAR
ncbi:MAG: hypothetical protein GY757_60910 [bacterium]|nr:hypothetical protein [bacterium]